MKKLIPLLKDATPLPGYRLQLSFADGVSGEVSLGHWVGKGVFARWNNEAAFCDFFITPQYKLQWPDEIDMDPDAFCLQIVGKTFEDHARTMQVLQHSH